MNGRSTYLHHEGGISRRRNATRSKVNNGEAAKNLGLPHEIHWSANLLRVDVELVVVHGLKSPDCPHDCSTVADSLDDVPSASLTLELKCK
jgi:hypothetical protein